MGVLYWRFTVEYVPRFWVPVIALPVIAYCWFFRRWLGKKELFVVILLSQIITICLLISRPEQHILYLLRFAFFPLAIYFFFGRWKAGWFIIWLVFMLVLCEDLRLGRGRLRDYYIGWERPNRLLKIDSHFKKNLSPIDRELAPLYRSRQWERMSDIEYLPNLLRKPFVFNGGRGRLTIERDGKFWSVHRHFAFHRNFLLQKLFAELIVASEYQDG